jgi:hypothetical protein
VQYKYKSGLVTQVTDADGTVWKRDKNGQFDQCDPSGNLTDDTASGAKFIPPISDTSLYENSGTGAFDKLSKELLDSEFTQSPYPNPGGDGPNANGVIQGEVLGDCYFLSSVASLAKEDPNAVKKMIHDNRDGTYTVTFPGDQSHPVTVEAPTADETTQFAADQNGALAAVLEKAHRYYTGRVASDNGDDPAKALQLLTGKSYQRVGLNYDNGQTYVPGSQFSSPPSDAEVGSLLSRALSSGQPIVSFTEAKTDLVDHHAYSVLAYDPTTQTVALRNPWQYLGSDPSHVKSLKDLGNGEFTLSLAEFDKEFAYLAIENS